MIRKELFLVSLMGFLLMGAAFQFGGIKHDITSQVTTSSSVVINSSSLQVQRFTGSSAQVVKLPAATGLKAGYWYTMINESTGALTITNSTDMPITTVAAATATAPVSKTFYVTSTATSGGPWTVDAGAGSGAASNPAVVYATVTGNPGATSANTTLNFPTEKSDPNNIYSAGTWTVPSGGYTVCLVRWYLTGDATNRIVSVYKDGSKYDDGSNNDTNGPGWQNGPMLVHVTTGSQLTIRADNSITGNAADNAGASCW